MAKQLSYVLGECIWCTALVLVPHQAVVLAVSTTPAFTRSMGFHIIMSTQIICSMYS